MRSSESALGVRAEILVVFGLLASAPAAAQQVGLMQQSGLGQSFAQQGGRANTTLLDVRAGATRSDNVQEAPANGSSDVIATVGANINVARQGSHLDYDLVGDFDWAHYIHNTYPGTFLGSFDGQADLKIVPGTFAWTAEETVSKLMQNPAGPNTPNNLQTVSYFTTGPRAELHLDNVSYLLFSGDYSKVSSDASLPGEQNVASTRYSGSASLVRRLSQQTALSLTGMEEAVQFDAATLNQDYHQDSALLGYQGTAGRTRFALSAGYTRLRLDAGNRSGMTAAVQLSRRVTASSTLLLSLTQQTADSADLLRVDLSSRLGVISGLQVTQSDPVQERAAEASWLFARERNSVGLSVDWTHDTGKVDHTLDRTWEIGRASYSRRLRPVLTLDLSAQYTHQDLSGLHYTYHELGTTVGLGWQVARRFSLSLHYDHLKRSAEGNEIIGSIGSFTENRIGLVGTYRVLGSGTR